MVRVRLIDNTIVICLVFFPIVIPGEDWDSQAMSLARVGSTLALI